MRGLKFWPRIIPISAINERNDRRMKRISFNGLILFDSWPFWVVHIVSVIFQTSSNSCFLVVEAALGVADQRDGYCGCKMKKGQILMDFNIGGNKL